MGFEPPTPLSQAAPPSLYLLMIPHISMEKVGILVVSKCLSSAAMVDAFRRSEKYLPEFYVIEKQANPFNRSAAASHVVVPDLALGEIARFAARFSGRIDFGVTDTEDFVVAGGRDVVEKKAGVPMVCVAKKFAVEGSKADQRTLFDEVFPEANPNYRVFDPANYTNPQEALSDFKEAAAEMGSPVIKPDAPARGAAVGVWGSDFRSEAEMSAFFLGALSRGRVVVEQKVEGEESSFHAFSDGKHFVPAPLSRDYKRSLHGGKGKLTGGMGSYRAPGRRLPFVTQGEWEHLLASEERAFRRWKGKGSEPGLRGVVLYDAIMHDGRGFKVLERNSRGGNTEFINLLSTLADDFVEVCYRIIEGNLRQIRFRPKSSVVTCAVPRGYGGAGEPAPQAQQVELTHAMELSRKSAGRIKVYPMDVREENGVTMMGTSRTVAAAGIGDTIEEARASSLKAVGALEGPLRWRTDIASSEDIERSSARMMTLRASA